MVKKVVFHCIGERWCYAIPREKVFEGLEMEPYIDLPVGTILSSKVGHADYNTATFDVGLAIVSISDGLNFTLTSNKDEHPIETQDGIIRNYQIKLVEVNGKSI